MGPPLNATELLAKKVHTAPTTPVRRVVAKVPTLEGVAEPAEEKHCKEQGHFFRIRGG